MRHIRLGRGRAQHGAALPLRSRRPRGTPLSDQEVKACRLVIRHRADEEADDPLVEAGPLQADTVDLDELRRMVRALNRTTVRGKPDAAVLLLAWWMAAPASEPARLNLHDAKITTVKIEEEDGRQRPRPAPGLTGGGTAVP
ncbi:hypothetical protein AQJ11_37590 [Streptomyces corchorusii]|uniref:Integrase n=2 Tax=Streptomyces TaxID=1883 RepID=A0A117QAH4_STRCK|nr:hypothetical protein [Streptomyces corchorusii]KUN17579.1 hypothetical protein AQJ11_37590 [Streptomyces corchorusii]